VPPAITEKKVFPPENLSISDLSDIEAQRKTLWYEKHGELFLLFQGSRRSLSQILKII